ncbi:alginate lyase family protein [Adhaeribacter swui]|uniref:Alginate lyase family protein n=1 Tax=Adhaeribacter swui TaxID=2086471 RepID=A0A7G7G379_9BACT|nr:alginate lyase family protein [Adhaeribacter swui]QNF31613.1 alginate lyase family protein [Adhaeribacter swui]
MENKFKINAGNEQCLAALKQLIAATAPSLSKTPTTIVNKSFTPPSGDKHDYTSLATYWWPNPKTASKLPYIRKDGQTNPEANAIKDNAYLRDLCKDIRLLGLCYYFTNDEKYASKATEMLKVFFLNSATRMNPHLKYAQMIKGDNKVYGTGTIDTEQFPELLDGVQLIVGSNSWTAANHAALQNWFNQYLNWLMTSDGGKEANAAPNNIGTHYNLQVVTYALFVGNKTLAKSLVETQAFNRLDGQFKASGEQTYELARTNSWTYCNKNLKGWFNLASVAESAGVNLWDYTTPSGKSLKKAFQWMIPYGAGTKSWSFDQIGTFKIEYFTIAARTGSAIYKDLNLQTVLAKDHARFMSGAYSEMLTSRYY